MLTSRLRKWFGSVDRDILCAAAGLLAAVLTFSTSGLLEAAANTKAPPAEQKVAQEQVKQAGRDAGQLVGGAVAGPAGAAIGGLLGQHGAEAVLALYLLWHRATEKKRHRKHSRVPDQTASIPRFPAT